MLSYCSILHHAIMIPYHCKGALLYGVKFLLRSYATTTKMDNRRKSFTLHFKANVLAKLKENGGNMSKTSRDFKVCLLAILYFIIYNFRSNYNTIQLALLLLAYDAVDLSRGILSVLQVHFVVYFLCPQ